MQKVAELKGLINHYTFFETMVYHTKTDSTYVDALEFAGSKPIERHIKDCKTYDGVQAYLAEKIKQHIANGEVSDFRHLQLRGDSKVFYQYSAAGNFFASKHYTMLVVLDPTNLNLVHATDFNCEIGERMKASPDGRMLCLLGWDKLLFIDTKTWQLIHKMKMSKPFSFGEMSFSPSGKKLLLTSEKGAHQLLDIENKPTLVFKTDAVGSISNYPFFFDENTVCGYNFDTKQTSFYDISSGKFVALDKQLPVNINSAMHYNGYLFNVTGTWGKPKNVIQVDLKDLSVVSDTPLGTTFSVTPIQYPHGNEFAFSSYIYDSDVTAFMKYNLDSKTLTEIKTIKGEVHLLCFVNGNTGIILTDGRPELIQL